MATTIKRNLKLGDLDAETDADLLRTCFIDNGTLEPIINVESPEAVVLGRTGTGKSALLLKVMDEAPKYSKKIDPTDISIRFLEHSDIILFFDELGVNLDLFYRFLWRHILTVELLNLRYDLTNQQGAGVFRNLLDRLIGKDKAKAEAVSYFEEWGDKFWISTDAHLREVTEKLESAAKAEFATGGAPVDISLKGSRNLTSEQKIEYAERAKRVVSSIQIQQLTKVLDLLREDVFNDPQKKYYILIDQLDEDWASTETRCRFIRALIEEIKTFRKLDNVKVIVALRRDLLELVFDKTRDAGFQEEKYESYILPLTWTVDELKQLLELRINEVFKRQYTKEGVSFEDLFPSPRGQEKETSFQFIIERTLLRPRDILQFANEAFKAASGCERISWKALSAADAAYSTKRMKSLQEEWSEIYPALDESLELLRGRRSELSRSQLTDERFNETVMQLHSRNTSDPCVKVVKEYFKSASSVKEGDILIEIIRALYRVGAIGVKISASKPYEWSYFDEPVISKGIAKRVNKLKVHKMLFRALDIDNSKSVIERRLEAYKKS